MTETLKLIWKAILSVLFSWGGVCDFDPSLRGANNISGQRLDPEGDFEWSEASLHTRCKMNLW